MNKTFVQEMKQFLLQKKAELEAELKAIGRKDQGGETNFTTLLPEYGDKEDENASEVATFTDNLALERTLERTLADVGQALGRVAKGTYGKCKYCGEEIDVRRLRARPESGSCVSCKTERLRRP